MFYFFEKMQLNEMLLDSNVKMIICYNQPKSDIIAPVTMPRTISPARTKQIILTVFLLIVAPLFYSVSFVLYIDSWRADRSLSGIVTPLAGILSFLYPFA